MIRRRPWSAYGLMIIGIILIVEPALPQYEFSAFWFGLGVLAALIAGFDLSRRS